MKKYLIVIVLIVVIVFVFVNKQDVPSVDIIEEESPLVVEDNAVVVGDQKPGDNVTVHYVKLKKPGYVSVYSTDDVGTKTLLGTSSVLPAGEHYNVPVKMKKTQRGGAARPVSIVAELNTDNGDGVFGEEDELIVDEDSGEAVDSEAMLDEDASDDINIGQKAEDDGYTVVEDENDGEAMEGDEDGEDMEVEAEDDGSGEVMDDASTESGDTEAGAGEENSVQ